MHQNVRKACVSDELDEADEGEAHSSVKPTSGKEKQPGACCDVERTKQEILDLMQAFKADVGRVLSGSIGVEPADVWGVVPTKEEPSKAAESASPIESEPTNASQDQPMEAEHSPERSAPPSPVIHSNIICDLCRDMIIGVRHKCLDCAGLGSILHHENRRH
jgi:next-to-BRCA1 protein 1